MGDLSRQSLIDDFKVSLQNITEYFKTAADADYIRLLDIAALDMSRIRPRILRASITLAEETTDYPAPTDIKRVTRTDWGRAARRSRHPWNSNWPGQLPDLSVIDTAAGVMLELSREVTAAEIADYGESCNYFYEIHHSIGTLAAATTIQAGDRSLLLLRAQVEAMTELTFRNVGKPVTLRDGASSQARNGTPAALAETLMHSWLAQAARVAS